MNRRKFLQGLLSLAALAIQKNGILRPSAEIEQPTRTIFDMNANTWRSYSDAVMGTKGVLTFWDGTKMLMCEGRIVRWELEPYTLVRLESLSSDWTATLEWAN